MARSDNVKITRTLVGERAKKRGKRRPSKKGPVLVRGPGGRPLVSPNHRGGPSPCEAKTPVRHGGVVKRSPPSPFVAGGAAVAQKKPLDTSSGRPRAAADVEVTLSELSALPLSLGTTGRALLVYHRPEEVFHNIARHMAANFPPSWHVEIVPSAAIPDLRGYEVVTLIRWRAASNVLPLLPKEAVLVLCVYSHYLWKRHRTEFDTAVERADIITGASQLLVEELREVLGRPIEYMSDGVDARMFTPSVNRLKSPVLRVGWAGNSKVARGVKNLQKLEEAAAQVSGVELVVADIARKRIPYVAMPEWYRGLSAIVCVSTSEGTPNPIMEGAASGLPYISTPVGLVPEIHACSQGGVLILEDSVAGIVEALETFKACAALHRKWGRKNREVMQRSWSWASRFHGLVERIGRICDLRRSISSGG